MGKSSNPDLCRWCTQPKGAHEPDCPARVALPPAPTMEDLWRRHAKALEGVPPHLARMCESMFYAGAASMLEVRRTQDRQLLNEIIAKATIRARKTG